MFFVIIAQQVEQAVYHEEIKFIIEIHPGFAGVGDGLFHGDDDVPQDCGVDVAIFTFPQGKGNDVRDTISGEIVPVYLPDRIIIYEQK
jgi:hypothetical protein